MLGVLGYMVGLSSLGDCSVSRSVEQRDPEPAPVPQDPYRTDYLYHDFKSDEYKAAVGNVLDEQRDSLYKH